MTLTEYLINGALVGLVFLQIRGRRLTVRTLLLPLVIVAVVANQYLRAIPTAGNDLVLVAAGIVSGLLLGTGAGLTTAVRSDGHGNVVAKAGFGAAALWVAGVGSRIAFSLYATHGGQPSIARFSAVHHITSGAAWVDAFVLMALAEVVSRTAVMGARFVRLQGAGTSDATTRPRPLASAIMDLRGRTF